MYYTYFHKFKKEVEIKDDFDFIMSGGKEGAKTPNLIDYSDRITREIHYQRHTALSAVSEDMLKTVVGATKVIVDNFRDKNMKELYHTFKIPKSSGGFRTITAPNENLKFNQKLVVDRIKERLKILEHNNAQAYVENKGIATNANFHSQSNNFAKVDFKDFFPSITGDLIKQVLPQLGAMSAIENEAFFDNIVYLCTLNGSLPQGAPSSPYLSNLVMLPFDYHMVELLKKTDIIYTRYADDITFSSFYKLGDKEYLEGLVKQAMQKAYGYEPLAINKKKTLITTKYGKNRVTGLKVNKDNNVTIGYKEKRNLKQELARLIIAKLKGEPISGNVKESVIGYFSHFKNIEPDYARYVERTLLKKFNLMKVRDLTQYLSN